MNITADEIHRLAADCDLGADALEAEAATLTDTDRQARKRVAAENVRRYARELRNAETDIDTEAARLVAHAAQMGGILMAGTTIEQDRATMTRLATAGMFVLINQPGQVPFYSIAGYHG